MGNLDLYNKARNVPQEAKKEISAGRLKGFTDINPMWRIKFLTEHFGMCGFGWYYDVVEQKLEDGSDGQKAAFVTVHLFVKVDNEWSKPIIGLGGSSFIANERNGAYTSDECFKMALTDALSIACKSLGVGADVYFAKDRTKYDQEQNQQKRTLPQIDVDREMSMLRQKKTVEELRDAYKSLPEDTQFALKELVAVYKNELIEHQKLTENGTNDSK